jgi:uncharacterized protein (DUF924 family)
VQGLRGARDMARFEDCFEQHEQVQIDPSEMSSIQHWTEIVSLDSVLVYDDPARWRKHMNSFIPLITLALAANPAPLVETDTRALAVVQFWVEAGPSKWFAKDPAFDALFREQFRSDYQAAARGDLMHWQRTAEGAFALTILLDQYPRNSFRGTPEMYATDPIARKVAHVALAAGYDKQMPVELRKFFLLPYSHSEDLADQERAVQLAAAISADDLAHAQHHRDIVKRFGRFPHRNEILGRTSTKEEQEYLDSGGYQG